MPEAAGVGIEVVDAEIQEGKARADSNGGRYADAERCFLQALTVRRAAYGDRHAINAWICGERGQLYDLMGRYNESLEVLWKGAKTFCSAQSESSISTGPLSASSL